MKKSRTNITLFFLPLGRILSFASNPSLGASGSYSQPQAPTQNLHRLLPTRIQQDVSVLVQTYCILAVFFYLPEYSKMLVFWFQTYTAYYLQEYSELLVFWCEGSSHEYGENIQTNYCTTVTS